MSHSETSSHARRTELKPKNSLKATITAVSAGALVFALALGHSSVALAITSGEPILITGFESGTLCAWTSSTGSPTCTATDVLSTIASASAPDEISRALTAEAELSLHEPNVPSEIIQALSSAAHVYADFPYLKDSGGQTLGEIHAEVQAELGISVTLAEILPSLTSDLQFALANPDQRQFQSLQFLFQRDGTQPPPLPLSPDTEVALLGKLIYEQWLEENINSGVFGPNISAQDCNSAIFSAETHAGLQFLAINELALNESLLEIILHSGEAALACVSGGISDLVKSVAKAFTGCVNSTAYAYLQVEAPAYCVDPLDEPEFLTYLTNCAATAIPCTGDVAAAVKSAITATQTFDNFTNGGCAFHNIYGQLYDACDTACKVPGLELQEQTPLCLSNGGDWCLDPLNIEIPVLSCVRAHGQVTLFSDDFNDGVYDPSKWTWSGHTVAEVAGELHLDQAVTDSGGVARTAEFPVYPVGLVTISRRTKIHAANNYFFAGASFYPGSDTANRFEVSYANYVYTGSGECESHGFALSRNGVLPSKCVNQGVDVTQWIPGVWDNWFDERFEWDPQSGDLNYYINDQLELSMNVGPLPANATTMHISLSPWGWYTGHYQYTDDLVVTQDLP